MKKVGFIDYYLDEWHANNYPEFFKKVSGGEMQVCSAFGEIDSPIGGMTNAEWSAKYNIPLASSIDEVIDKSDCLVVLAPDSPETHLRLTDKALKSGKRVYIDKTFALTRADAEAIFENADKHSTPCYSSSALFFSDEIQKIDKNGILRINSSSHGYLKQYAIHQVEQIVALMGSDVRRLMLVGSEANPLIVIEYKDGRYAQMNHYIYADFKLDIGYEDGRLNTVEIKSDYFANCINSMVNFFNTGDIPVSHEQTIGVISIIEGIYKALEAPGTWINI